MEHALKIGAFDKDGKTMLGRHGSPTRLGDMMRFMLVTLEQSLEQSTDQLTN